MTSRKLVSFKDFTAYFPEIELPVILTKDSASEFSRYNKPFNNNVIEEYFVKWDKEIDEYSEFLPCFKIPETGEFTAFVYYKASLLKYGFYIITFDKNNDLLSIRPLNSIEIKAEKIENSAVIIDEDWLIRVVAGEQELHVEDYDANESRMSTMEILPTGDIIYSS